MESEAWTCSIQQTALDDLKSGLCACLGINCGPILCPPLLCLLGFSDPSCPACLALLCSSYDPCCFHFCLKFALTPRKLEEDTQICSVGKRIIWFACCPYCNSRSCVFDDVGMRPGQTISRAFWVYN